MNWQTVKELYWRDEGGRLQALSAGSGLVQTAEGLWAIADDLHHLVQISLEKDTHGSGFRLFAGDLPDDPVERKAAKKDTEALFALPMVDEVRLMALPSGSKRYRSIGSVIRFAPTTNTPMAQIVDFKSLFKVLRRQIDDLNIEGGLVARDKVVLLQRGNGAENFNAVIEMDQAAFVQGLAGDWDISALKIKIISIELPKWDGVALGFTDGFFHDGVIYFAAAAEASPDTFNDGEVRGSVLGALRGGFEPLILARIEKIKIEGLTLAADRGAHLEVLAVTDADDPKVASLLLHTRIAK